MIAMGRPTMFMALSATLVQSVHIRHSHSVATGSRGSWLASEAQTVSDDLPDLAEVVSGDDHPLRPDYADVTYKVLGNTPLQLDIFLPQERLASGSPAIINIRGGMWSSSHNTMFRKWHYNLKEEGFAEVSINYRLTSEDPDSYGGAPVTWPAQAEDFKDAIRWLKKEGPSYGIDPGRLGCWGESSGGHLCNWLGVAGAANSDTRLNLVVSMFGFTCFLCSPWTDKLLGKHPADWLFDFPTGTLDTLKKIELGIVEQTTVPDAKQLVLVEQCSGNDCQECEWDGEDADGRQSLGGDGHTEEECQNECVARADCNVAAISKSGLCHIFKTCSGRQEAGWKRWKKVEWKPEATETVLDLVRDAEPTFHIKQADSTHIPRFFIGQGLSDDECEPDEADFFVHGLLQAGVAVNVTKVPGGGHGYSNWPDWPIEQAMLFVKQYL